MKVTISVIKADVGSIGGHTKPSYAMLNAVDSNIESAIINSQLLLDGITSFTGDDIALVMSHNKGVGSKEIHGFAWNTFLEATQIAKDYGLYGAGQDLLVDAPSGNIRGAGPAVAEIEFDLLPNYRQAEAFLVFGADKCAPGAYSVALWNTFCNPMHNGGLLLSPKLLKGFTVTVIDMDHKSQDSDRVVTINTAEEHGSIKLAALLRNMDRFAVESVHSNAHPNEQIVSLSATRLHNIAGKYTGKDDPVMIFRTQGIFPAPEEVVSPYNICPYITGDCRGSHVMALMPMALNTPVRGNYCQPIVSCTAFSMDKDGYFTDELVDVFDGQEWNVAREKALTKSNFMREQGCFGVAMASEPELAYTGLVEIMKSMESRFEIRKNIT